MRKIFAIALLLSCTLMPMSAAAGSSHGSPASHASPESIVSLAPNLTEILFAIGVGNRVVGVTDYCDHPEEAKLKPKVGGMSNPSLEAVVSLEPDLVVMTTDGNPQEIAKKLGEFGVDVYVEDSRRLASLPDAVRRLGAAVGAGEKAEALAITIEHALASFKDDSPGGGRTALFIVWPEPLIVAGPGTVVHDVMVLLGLENVAQGAKTNYPKYSLEEAIRQDPELIFIGLAMGTTSMERLSARLLERLEGTRAVREGNVHFLGDGLYRLGPRVVDGIREMQEAIK